MKIKHVLATVGAVLAFASTVIAGSVTNPVSAVIDKTDGALTVGYDSHYIFRGQTFGQDAVWSAIDLSAPLISGVTVNGGAFYVNSSDDDFEFDKLNLFATLGTTVGAVDIEVGYIANLFPGNSNDTSNEVQVGVGTSFGLLDVGGAYVYNWDTELHYLEAIAGVSFDLNDTISADADVTVAFNEDEYSHTVARLALPVAVTEFVTLTPYVAGVFRDEGVWANESEQELIGGASLSVSF